MHTIANRDAPHVVHDAPATTTGVPEQRLKVADLLGHRREAILEHNGSDYRLRITSNGKLILTK